MLIFFRCKSYIWNSVTLLLLQEQYVTQTETPGPPVNITETTEWFTEMTPLQDAVGQNYIQGRFSILCDIVAVSLLRDFRFCCACSLSVRNLYDFLHSVLCNRCAEDRNKWSLGYAIYVLTRRRRLSRCPTTFVCGVYRYNLRSTWQTHRWLGRFNRHLFLLHSSSVWFSRAKTSFTGASSSTTNVTVLTIA